MDSSSAESQPVGIYGMDEKDEELLRTINMRRKRRAIADCIDQYQRIEMLKCNQL